jgi:CBS domain-containing protein
MYVNEAMTTDVKTCKTYNSLNDVARLMWEGDCGAIPVVSDDNKPLGIITDRDIAMSAMLNHQALWEIQASTVIQGQSLCCCDQRESIESCLRKMEKSEVRRALITDEAGCLAGILSMGDALAFTRQDSSARDSSGRESYAKKADKVEVDNVLGMLKKVTAHHADGKTPIRKSEQITDFQPNMTL